MNLKKKFQELFFEQKEKPQIESTISEQVAPEQKENKKALLTFYSKKGCSPCEFWFPIFKAKFNESYYEKITLQSNQEATEAVTKYGVKTVPFLVIGENTVIPSKDLINMLKALN
jgi:glutaredoxin